MAYKWNLLLRSGGVSVPMWRAIHLYFVGHLFGGFTPGAIGADAYRVTALSGFGKTKVVVSTILFERLIGIIVLGLFVTVTLPVAAQYLPGDWDVTTWPIVITVTLGGILLLVLIWLNPSIIGAVGKKIPYLSKSGIEKWVQRFYSAYFKRGLPPQTMVVFTALTAAEILVSIYVIYLAARALGIAVSFGFLLCVIPLLMMLIRLPISVQGFGVQEGLFAYFFLVGGFSTADGLAISALLRVTELILCFLPAGIVLWVNPLRLDPSNDSV